MMIATEGINNETEADNLKAPPRNEMIQWILDAGQPFLQK